MSKNVLTDRGDEAVQAAGGQRPPQDLGGMHAGREHLPQYCSDRSCALELCL